jgi:multidrug efflux pump subunit AcrA (membrane-fusion protein)
MPGPLNKIVTLLAAAALLMASCKEAEKKEKQDEPERSGTPVTVTSIGTEPLTEYVELNATSTFQQKSYVKANVNGYVERVETAPGKYVSKGQELFVLKTKEAQSIGSTVNKLDPTFRFSGVNNIKSSADGFITQLSHQVGDYVQDGEQLAVISDESSFAFIMNLPYELRQYMANNKVVDMTLPDGTKVKGAVASYMPNVDAATQTLNVVIKPTSGGKLPENLIAKVHIVKTNKTTAPSLPKEALLTNDVQNEYWVMKLTDSATAVKVPVKKGIETNGRVEILEPQFAPADKILVTGNYGLPDTAKVIVQH